MKVNHLNKLLKLLKNIFKSMKVKIRKLNEQAVIPKYSKSGDAGMDLTATSVTVENGVSTYGTGLSVEIPEGFVGLVFPRSSIYKTNLIQSNAVGVIDSGYRGEIMVKFYNYKAFALGGGYQVGDRIAQLIIIPYPDIEFTEVQELATSERGESGFGSTN